MYGFSPSPVPITLNFFDSISRFDSIVSCLVLTKKLVYCSFKSLLSGNKSIIVFTSLEILNRYNLYFKITTLLLASLCIAVFISVA